MIEIERNEVYRLTLHLGDVGTWAVSKAGGPEWRPRAAMVLFGEGRSEGTVLELMSELTSAMKGAGTAMGTVRR